MVDKRIGRYQIVEEIGRGGMAVVYRAYDPHFERDVAIKVLPKEFLNDSNLRARFEREAKTVALLEHAAIVPVYDFGEYEEQPFIVMRFMSGGSLADKLENGRMNLDEVIVLFQRLSPALDAAHEKGIIHRDLKPANILFDQYGDAYISDFGIARMAEQTGTTLTGTAILGTPAYMSPEQIQGDKELDGRSDIYSLGVILFECLSGIPPFKAETPAKVLMMHLLEPVPPIHNPEIELPKDIDNIIKQAMAKRKFARYDTAMDMVRALTMTGTGEMNGNLSPTVKSQGMDEIVSRPTSRPRERPITPTPNPEPIKKTSKKRKFAAVVGIIAIIILFLVIAGLIFFQPQLSDMVSALGGNQLVTATATETIPPSSTSTLLPSKTILPSTTPEPTKTSTQELPIAIPSPTSEILPEEPINSATPSLPTIGGADQLAFVKGGDIWISNVDGTNATRITNTGGTKTDLQWSPDGQWVNFIFGRCVQSVNIETQQVNTILCVNWAEYLAAFTISPDYSQVAISLSDGLFILPYDLQELSSIKRQDQLKAADACIVYTALPTKDVLWSHDGKRIAVVVESTNLGRKEDLVRIFEITGCKQSLLLVDQFPGVHFTPTGFSSSPVIESLGWDGDQVFALNIDKRSTFGEMWTYSMSTYAAKSFGPVDNQCCYRDFRWSPDGQHILFSFIDVRYMNEVFLYLVEYGSLETQPVLRPISFEEGFFSSKDKPQAALRPQK